MFIGERPRGVDDELGHVHPSGRHQPPFYVAEHLSGCDGARISSANSPWLIAYLLLEVRLPAKDPK